MDSISSLQSTAAIRSPTHLSIYGSLLLVGAVAATRGQDLATAREFLDEAAITARYLGRDANHRWTAFGPTNVAIHRTSTALESGDIQTAVNDGPRLDCSTLPLERRIRHTFDVARAYSAQNRVDEALELILDAEEIAPEQVRHHSSRGSW